MSTGLLEKTISENHLIDQDNLKNPLQTIHLTGSRSWLDAKVLSPWGNKEISVLNVIEEGDEEEGDDDPGIEEEDLPANGDDEDDWEGNLAGDIDNDEDLDGSMKDDAMEDPENFDEEGDDDDY